MYYFITTYDSYSDEYSSSYTTKFFKTRKAFEAYLATLEDKEVYSTGFDNVSFTPDDDEVKLNYPLSKKQPVVLPEEYFAKFCPS